VSASAPVDPPAIPRVDPIDLRGEWTQYVSSHLAGRGDSSLRYGGRLDGYVRIDGERAGLWKGLTINAQAEFIYGKSTNRIGDLVLLPVNAGLLVPTVNDEGFDFSLNVVQRFGKFRIQLGKINLFDASSAVPISSGGGKQGFQHVGLASPPGMLVSTKVLGGIATVQAGRLIFNLGIWTPEDWTRRYLPRVAFDHGVNGMIAVVLPARIAGRRGFHTFTIYGSNRRVNGQEEYPDLQPPEGSSSIFPSTKGGTHIRYTVQQYLWEDPADPQRGWGFFGHFGVSKGVPGIIDWTTNVGLAGSVPFRGRPRDRFGIGYYRYSLTQRLIDGLAPRFPLGYEQGGEIYYTARIAKRADLTFSGQLVDPVVASAPKAAYLNLRLKAEF